jgi:cytochrome c-type biogenesis protein CcmH/NrfG
VCVLQIEEAMLYGRKGPRTEEQPSSKRRRAVAAVPASEPSPPADEASWAALADVYMQLGEYHLAHVAYATRIAR